MPDKAEHGHDSSGIFAGTIFEGGLSGAKHDAHHAHDGFGYEYIEHTWFGHFLFEWIGEWGVSRALSLWIIFLGLLLILADEIPHFAAFALEWLAGTAPIWLLASLGVSAWRVWIWYVQGLYISGRDPILLEIKVPREIDKSPRAMEMVFTSLVNTSSEGTFLHRIWRGQMRTWYSFEYASFGGEVHMYVWVWKAYQRVIESAFYAQYPGLEIKPVEDYASKFRYDPAKHRAFVTEHKYSESDAYPIKTYIEFELDKDPKEEYKVDPLGQLFEYLSSLRPGEQVWAQIIVRTAGKHGSIFNPTDGAKEWRKRVADEVVEVRRQASLNSKKEESFPRPTWKQTEQIRIMERQLGKLPFEVAIRACYIADTSQTAFAGGGYGGMRLLWRAFGAEGYLNQLRPSNGHNIFDYPWQDFMGIRDRILTRRFIDAYRRRDAFFAPWYIESQVMTNESLATIYRPPSATVAAPGFQRIPATKSEPPPNLPK